jgi:hypothetical protein
MNNSCLYNLKNVPKTSYGCDFDTINISGGEVAIRLGHEVRMYKLTDMEEFTIFPRNGNVNNCISCYDRVQLNK